MKGQRAYQEIQQMGREGDVYSHCISSVHSTFFFNSSYLLIPYLLYSERENKDIWMKDQTYGHAWLPAYNIFTLYLSNISEFYANLYRVPEASEYMTHYVHNYFHLTLIKSSKYKKTKRLFDS